MLNITKVDLSIVNFVNVIKDSNSNESYNSKTIEAKFDTKKAKEKNLA